MSASPEAEASDCDIFDMPGQCGIVPYSFDPILVQGANSSYDYETNGSHSSDSSRSESPHENVDGIRTDNIAWFVYFYYIFTAYKP